MVTTGIPATVAVCASLPGDLRPDACRSWLVQRRHAAVPVTWAMGVTVMEGLAAVLDQTPACDVAVALEHDWLDSRQTLRSMIARARRTVPNLCSVVLRGTRALEHRAVLVEEGIRLVLVDAFDGPPRRDRRPAPPGWPVRNLAWGLWEVRIAESRRPGLWSFLTGQGPLARPAVGSLRVLHAGDVAASGGTAHASGSSLDRWLTWVERCQAEGTVTPVSLTTLARMLAGSASDGLGGSVLRAA